MSTPTERAEARAQDEARAHARPVRLTRAEVERVLASIPLESSVVLKQMLADRLAGPALPAERLAVMDLLRSLAEGMA